ncbi:MAG TPA: porphobilinogen synthase [Thermoplasmata archaeon]|nr:porphobilinogen synthase [Thermoplasmata archaeon]
MGERRALLRRPRRLRRTAAIRDLVRETRWDVSQLIQPIFVREDERVDATIESMPGVRRLTVPEVADEVAHLEALGLKAVLLFGIPSTKDEVASRAYANDGVVQQALRAIAADAPNVVTMADVCLCQYTDHGHCGVTVDGRVDNDASLDLLARTALSLARAGADVVAPSAMMDGQVAAIRTALDAAGLEECVIMSYAAKHASAFYGPFREAAESAPQFGDRRGYQMDPANPREALREVALDLEEGADLVMVKPALAFLDVIRAVRARFDAPLAAYSVSGEYAMVKAAAAKGWLDERDAVTEILTAIRRAGADLIITYHAKDVAEWTGAGRRG